MSLAAPWFLLALAIIPLGVLAQRLARSRRARYAVRFPSAGTLGAVMAAQPAWRRRVPAGLLALAAACLAVALARPQATVAVPIERASVVMVMDASRSMQATDVAPDRFTAAKTAADGFLDELPESLRTGLVGYSDSPHTVQALTDDREAVRSALAALRADGGTATGDALSTARELIEADTGKGKRPPTAVVLLSDGKSEQGSDPVEAARRLGAMNVPVYTVALGTPQGTVEGGPGSGPLPVPPDPETLREIAAVSGGQAFAAEDSDSLSAVYERLGSQVGTRAEEREVTAAVAGGALALLLAGLMTGLRWRGRIA